MKPQTEYRFTIGTLLVNIKEMQAQDSAGRKFRLTRKECAVLSFFSYNKDQVLSKQTMLELIWNYDCFARTNTLEVHISRIRKILRENSSKVYIETVHGTGYRLRDLP